MSLTTSSGRGAPGDLPVCLVGSMVPPRQGGRGLALLGGSQEPCLLPEQRHRPQGPRPSNHILRGRT